MHPTRSDAGGFGVLVGLLAGLLVGLELLSACSSSAGIGAQAQNGLPLGTHGAPDAHGRLLVVAGENVWGDIARQIGGDAVTVTSIISDPNVDPHDYESNVNDAAAISSAAVVIENGAGYDDFLSRLVGGSSVRGRTVLSAQHVVGVPADANPHLWYDPGYALAVARGIEQAFAAKAPADASAFAVNLASFDAAEQEVVAVIDRIRAKYAGTGVAYTERVAGYLIQAAGLNLVSPASFAQAIEDGNDPSPVDNITFERVLRTHQAKVLLYNSQVTDPITDNLRRLARSSGVPVVGVSETIPTGEKDFQTWQADQARALLAALGG